LVPPALDDSGDEDTELATPEEVAAMQARIDAILDRPRIQRSAIQMAGDVLDFLCRVPVDKFAPAEAAGIAEPAMVSAIDRYVQTAIPWIGNFADSWRERGGDEADPAEGADDDLVTGIVGHIWAAKHERPEMPVSQIRAALNYVFKLIGRGVFDADVRP
jgi:hypothetical protein